MSNPVMPQEDWSDYASPTGPDTRQADSFTLKEIARNFQRSGTRCFCDLDRWEPEESTGHSWVCPLHKLAMRAAGKGES